MSPQTTAQPLFTAMQLGQMLKSARKRRKLTQSMVASRLGLSQNRVSHLELHPEELSLMQLLTWSAVVGLELSIGERLQNGVSSTAEW